MVARLARLADLTVVPHPSTGGISHPPTHYMLCCSTAADQCWSQLEPAPPDVGTRVCVAWNGTAEASAAIMVLLPWFGAVQAVQVLYADEYQTVAGRQQPM